MKKLGWIAVLALVVVACSTGADMMGAIMDSGVPDAGAQPGVDGKFVGYTSEGYKLTSGNDGQGGLFNTYAACQSDFGASARICTIAEVLTTVDLPAPPPPSNGDLREGASMVEGLGQAPSCWNGGNTNYYLTPGGGISSEDRCSSLRVLACCTTN